MTFRTILELIALGAAILGVPVAVYQLYVGRREAQAGRDLDVALALSESFRVKWDSQWAQALRSTDSSESDEIALEGMLNWVDWLGTLMKHGHLADTGVVLDTLTFPINDLLELYRDRIRLETAEHGRNYWGGVLEVASKTWPDFEDSLARDLGPRARGGR